MTRCTLTGFVSTARSVRTLWVLGTMIVLSATHVRSDTQELSTPRQIHMAHGEDAMSRHITWVTDVAASTQVWYGYDANSLFLHQSGYSTSLPDVEETYIHHTHLWELKQNTTYYWKIKGDTRVFTFRTDGGKETTELPSTLIYADPSPFSVTHASIAARITSTSTVIHVGDVDNNRFMNGIESVASHVPYMMGVGEHDVDNPLINQFWMPETDGIKQLWYSWNAGGVHYISLPTPLVINTTTAPIILDWLSHDLIHASHPNVRTFYPFVVIYMSEPSHMEIIQPYLQYVDLVISSHDAPYKRSKHEIINIALDTHVRDHDGKKMMADVVPSYGYIKAINATHMEYQQIASTSGIVLDHVWIYANTTRAA